MAEPREIDPDRTSCRKDGRCYRGHLMTQSNTYVLPNGYTACRRCKAQREAERYQAKKAAARRALRGTEQ